MSFFRKHVSAIIVALLLLEWAATAAFCLRERALDRTLIAHINRNTSALSEKLEVKTQDLSLPPFETRSVRKALEETWAPALGARTYPEFILGPPPPKKKRRRR